MSTTLQSQPTSSMDALDRALEDLAAGSRSLATATLTERRSLAQECIRRTFDVARQWTSAAWQAKRLNEGDAARAEDIATGPVSVIRYLQLLTTTLTDIERTGQPRLPAKPVFQNGQHRIRIFPTGQLFDRLLFAGMEAETWLEPSQHDEPLFNRHVDELAGRVSVTPGVAAVMGAGNVSAIPATDALTKILQESQAVLLKMNPVNDYLGPIFERALAPLIERNWLRICYGGAAEGAHIVASEQVASIHLTGSIATHDAIVWGSDGEQEQRRAAGQPLTTKTVTSELGNVTPWAVIPGELKPGQLDAQAEHVAASIINNVSFNCIATKMIITWKQWPDRTRFLDRVDEYLASAQRRFAYYPGAAERYERFADRAAPEGDPLELPWTLVRDVSAESAPHFYDEESFVCVCGETAIDADSPEAFVEAAVELMNERLWGNLAAAVTVPDGVGGLQPHVDRAIESLRFGTIGVNVWPGIAYALMSPPWGGYPENDLADAQSGIGSVHNTYFLNRPQKTILRAPLKVSPKPMWFPSHRRPVAVAERLLAVYAKPSLWRLPPLLMHALRG